MVDGVVKWREMQNAKSFATDRGELYAPPAPAPAITFGADSAPESMNGYVDVRLLGCLAAWDGCMSNGAGAMC